MRFPRFAAPAVLAILAGLFFVPSASAANIAVNPGFEAGLSGWNCSAGQVVSTPVRTGTGALQATPAGHDLARCSQTLTVQPSTRYALSAWVRGSYVFLGATGTGGTDPQTWGTPGGAWTQLRTSFTTGASTTSVTVYLHGWYGSGAYLVDDVEVDGPGGPPPVDTTPPTVPGNVSVGGATATSLLVSWSASTDNVGVARYEVSRDNAVGASVTGTTFTASGLAPRTSYGFRVRACDAAGNCSAWSGSASGTTSDDTVPPPGNLLVAPYIDITMARPSLVEAARATGVKNYTLAFALGDNSGCNPSWGGTIPITEPRIVNDVRALKALGGNVIVATGGAQGPYLEHACGSVATLLAAYKASLDAVGSNHLDIDIEASIDTVKVNTALKQLQSERGTVISYTLRIQGQDYGIDPFSESIVRDAAARGVEIMVNPMLMNFGGSGDWGQAMVSAAAATMGQMRTIWPGRTDAQLYRQLGLTPMIGKNDTGPVTTQANARTVLAYAKANHVGRVAFWSIARDNGGCPNGSVSPTCSGISQSQYEFSGIFGSYTG